MTCLEPADTESLPENDLEETTVIEVELTGEDSRVAAHRTRKDKHENQDEIGPVGEKAEAALGLT